jgi:hypothetical protein
LNLPISAFSLHTISFSSPLIIYKLSDTCDITIYYDIFFFYSVIYFYHFFAEPGKTQNSNYFLHA